MKEPTRQLGSGLGDSGLLYRLYEQRLLRQIRRSAEPPEHVAMIVDGNRRWAKQLGYLTAQGHRAGAAKMLEFLGWCHDLDIQVVTLYLLSTDNLRNRDAEELRELSEIIGDLASSVAEAPSWRALHVGSELGLPESLVVRIREATSATKANTGMIVNLAIGYGGRSEIIHAMRAIVASHHAEGRSLEDLAERLTPELIGEHLYTSGQPDPDLVIRTSGEQRLSDFMLWQAAHSEFYFVEALGPELRKIDFLRALRDYMTRVRRFGG